MKKTSLLMVAVFSVTMLFAQTSSFGIKGGANLSTLTNNQGGEREHKIGFNVGALAHLHMGAKWALQPEVVYSSQGTEYMLGNTEHKLKLDYLNVPFLFQYFAAPGVRLQTGPQVGFLLDVADKVGDVETGFFDKTDYKDIDASWSFGASYVSRAGIGIDGRYNLGLSNINNTLTSGSSGVVKNSVFQVGLFYQFSGR
jgi:hypothetical protein